MAAGRHRGFPAGLWLFFVQIEQRRQLPRCQTQSQRFPDITTAPRGKSHGASSSRASALANKLRFLRANRFIQQRLAAGTASNRGLRLSHRRCRQVITGRFRMLHVSTRSWRVGVGTIPGLRNQAATSPDVQARGSLPRVPVHRVAHPLTIRPSPITMFFNTGCHALIPSAGHPTTGNTDQTSRRLRPRRTSAFGR